MKKVINGKITPMTKVLYGMGEMTFGVTNTILSVYLLITLTDYLKIEPVWASVIVVAGIVWDAVTDPVVGWLSDNSGGKFGRRRRYFLFYAIPLGLSFFLLWMSPALMAEGTHEAVKIIVVLILYLCTITMLTLVNVPYGSIIMEMTDDYDERTSLTGFRMVCSALATLLAIGIGDTILGEGPIYETGKNLIYVGLVFGIFVTAAAFLCYLGTFERRSFVKPALRPKFNFKKYVLESWKSKPFRQVSIAYLCAFTVIGLLQTLLQYYCTYWLRAPELFVVLAGGVLAVAIVSTPLWTFIAKKYGKKNAFLMSSALSVLSLIGIFFVGQLDNPEGIVMSLEASMAAMPVYGYIFIALLGVGVGGVQLMPFSMMPDAINFSMKEGDVDEGAYYGIVTFVQKLGMGAATMLIGPVLSLSGYEEPPKNQPKGILHTQDAFTNEVIRAMFVGLSIIIIVIGALAVWKYTIDRDALHKKINKTED
ncbi:MAG: MFS transporter [Clostridiales bacterium]|jgi:Na+/melibiose symporter-like transporter|nr:MFS transporter [Clostridiales bacterium]